MSAGYILSRERNQHGSNKWYQDLQFQYSASLDNQIGTYDSLLFTKNVWNNMRNGFKHEAPLSIQFRPFKNFSISPQVTYIRCSVYPEELKKDGIRITLILQQTRLHLSRYQILIRGTFYGHSINPSVSASFNPQLFGTFNFKPESRVQSIRHVVRPSVSFSYTPFLQRT